jgi:hypothetical protein
METSTIILLIGLLMIFIGIFGGGFEVKEIKVPKVNTLSRLLGFVIGAVLIIWSRDIFPEILPSLSSGPDQVVPEGKPSDKNDYYKLEAAWNNLAFENDLLLKEYTKLDTSPVKQKLDLEKRNTLTQRIEQLQNSINGFNTLEAMDGSDTLTVIEKLNKWNDHDHLERLSVNDEKEINKHIEEYDDIKREWATITSHDNFVTCSSVNKTKNKPNGEKIIFTQKNSVWVWARINAPQKEENLRLKWLDNKGNLLKEVSRVRVTQSNGYRTYYSKRFDEAGKYEVRLYNSQNHLIGRQKFEVIQ